MKKPYLVNYMKEDLLIENNNSYYDYETQISYTDNSKKIKVIDKVRFGYTRETRIIENSDSDQLLGVGSTKYTFTKEESDADELMYLGRTGITETVEDSDPDELLNLGSTRFTKAKEDSDPDELILF